MSLRNQAEEAGQFSPQSDGKASKNCFGKSSLTSRRVSREGLVAFALLGAGYLFGQMMASRMLCTHEAEDLFLMSRNTGNNARAQDAKEKDSNHTVYLHVHIAKTAGTTVNGYLALHYERVCGHKGYSYMYTNFNRIRAQRANRDEVFFSAQDRVPHGKMDEIGYEDCDYVSWERPFHAWLQSAGTASPLTLEPGVRYEMHLPCRDPIVHFESRCHHMEFEFDCSQPLLEQVHQCDIEMNRFSPLLNETYDLRCFNASKVYSYLDYMDLRLQRKRSAFLTNYTHRSTNSPRTKSCLDDTGNAEKTRELERWLIDNDEYYGFCNKCMGSSQELPF